MKIGFDAKRLFHNFTGLGNYSRFVVGSLLEHTTGNRYVLYTPKARQHPEIDPITDHANVTVITPPVLYNLVKASSLWRSWGISYEPTIKSLDVFHGLNQELPANLPGSLKKIVTVHDLIFLRFPKLYNPVDVRIYEAKVKAASQSAQSIVAISRQTAEDLVDFLKIPESKIKVVYQGCHPQFMKCIPDEEVSKTKSKYNLPHQYVLNVGTMEARKNVVLIIKAMALLPPDSRFPLIIMGRETTYKKQVVAMASRLGVLNSVIFLHDVPFTDFPAIYQGAQLFVYPSLFEGFGIPLVEAIESGIPVITSTGSCFSEAAGPSSIYVNPTKEDELAHQITRVLGDGELRRKMIDESKEYVRRFSASQITNELMSVYRS